MSTAAHRILFFGALSALALALTFGILYVHVPFVNNDEVWMISRGLHMATSGLPGEPLSTATLTPLGVQIFRAGIAGPVMGALYYGTIALGSILMPDDVVVGYRIMMTLWGVLGCLALYGVARAVGLDRLTSFLAAGVLAALPEFTSQVHFERFELMLTVLGIVQLRMHLAAEALPPGWLRTSAFFFIALFSWAPAILVHPSGICLPAMHGLIYLTYARPKGRWGGLAGLAIGFLPGAFLFLDLMLAPSRIGAGDFGLAAQGPPILLRDLWYFVKTPLHLYERLSAINSTSQLVSGLWFAAAIVAAVYLYRRHMLTAPMRAMVVGAIAVLASLVLFSGSYGPYVVIAAPFAAVLLAAGVAEALRERRTLVPATAVAVAMVAIAASNLLGSSFHREQNRVLASIESELRRTIPPGAGVSAAPIFYLGLRSNPFMLNIWMGTRSGPTTMSFEEGIHESRAEYIVLDDLSLCSAIKGARDSTWIADMRRFLTERCILVREIDTRFFNSRSRIAVGIDYPEWWPPVEEGYIRTVHVYKVRQAASLVDNTQNGKP